MSACRAECIAGEHARSRLKQPLTRAFPQKTKSTTPITTSKPMRKMMPMIQASTFNMDSQPARVRPALAAIGPPLKSM